MIGVLLTVFMTIEYSDGTTDEAGSVQVYKYLVKQAFPYPIETPNSTKLSFDQRT